MEESSVMDERMRSVIRLKDGEPMASHPRPFFANHHLQPQIEVFTSSATLAISDEYRDNYRIAYY